MIRWARNKDFDGDCCADCCPKDKAVSTCLTSSEEAEKPKEPEQKRMCSSSRAVGLRGYKRGTNILISYTLYS